jgi:hypothetical protein
VKTIQKAHSGKIRGKMDGTVNGKMYGNMNQKSISRESAGL